VTSLEMSVCIELKFKKTMPCSYAETSRQKLEVATVIRFAMK